MVFKVRRRIPRYALTGKEGGGKRKNAPSRTAFQNRKITLLFEKRDLCSFGVHTCSIFELVGEKIPSLSYIFCSIKLVVN